MKTQDEKLADAIGTCLGMIIGSLLQVALVAGVVCLAWNATLELHGLPGLSFWTAFLVLFAVRSVYNFITFKWSTK